MEGKAKKIDEQISLLNILHFGGYGEKIWFEYNVIWEKINNKKRKEIKWVIFYGNKLMKLRKLVFKQNLTLISIK